MLEKKSLVVNFSQGLETKTDPWQIPIGKFLVLENSIFTNQGMLRKRNGYGPLAMTMKTVNSPAMNTVTTPASNYVTTFNGNLTSVGSSLFAYSSANESLVKKGNLQPISLSVLPTVRSALSQTQADTAKASNGLICTAYTEVNNGTSSYKYTIQDSVTGQNIVNPVAIPIASGAITGSPRVFILGGYFIIAFTNTISGTKHLQYIAVSINNPTTVTANADIVASYDPATTVSWGGVVYGNNLFVAYNTTAGAQQVGIVTLSAGLLVSSPVNYVGSIATMMSMAVDTTNSDPVIYAAFYDSGSTTGYVVAVDQLLNKRMSATQIISSGVVNNITCIAQNGILTAAYEVSNTYSYDSAVATNLLKSVSVTLPATVTTGTAGTTTTFLRSVGLASKAFLYNSTMYMLVAYQSSLQNTYFLSDISGNLIARFAYENGGGYLATGLPQAQLVGSTVTIAYLFKDLIQSTNTAGLAQSIGAAGASNIYSQTGVNLASLTFAPSVFSVSEIGSNLNIAGGFLWAYDGQTIGEQGFHIFPDNVELVGNHTAGSMTAQQYYYQVTYEWTDAQGNIIRSAPSVPVSYTIATAPANFTGNRTSGSPTIASVSSFTNLQVGQPITGTGIPANTYILTLNSGASTLTMSANASSGSATATTITPTTLGSLTVNVPTLRLSHKSGVKIIVYRWSAAQQNYYQVTSISAPTLNDATVDSIAYVDSLADSSIIGNSLIYTTGGVLENIAGPAFIASTLFDDRLLGITAEDPNLVWESKQVIEGTPVEMSDLITTFVAPTIGAQGSTGSLKCLFPMDDKVIYFKKDAMYYMNGSGPDNTGANSQYSQPLFITSSVGCSNQNSIVLIPAGLMFQSDKGIWLLGRDLSTKYIGEAVEAFNSYTVTSAVSVPGTTQVRFTLSNGLMLMYDYFYDQWGTFRGAQAVSSTLYQGLHTIINSQGLISQETPGIYVDNGVPVNIAFTTGWLYLAGIQGYMRVYEIDLLASYVSPHKLYVELAYDFEYALQQSVISPSNFTSNYGDDSIYGQSSPFGGPGPLEQWRIQTDVQQCQTIQISLREVFDPSFGVSAGAGFTLSAMTAVLGVKKTYRPFKSANTVGSNG